MEAVTLAGAKAAARRLAVAQSYPAALETYDRILGAAPQDGEVRRRVAQLLVAVGAAEEAAAIHRALAEGDARAGHPLPALVACCALRDLGHAVERELGRIADTYAASSPKVARFAARPAPLPPGTLLSLPASRAEPFDELVSRAARRAADLATYKPASAEVHPVPLLSALPRAPLLTVLRELRCRALVPGDRIIQEGTAGEALFFLAGGELRVFTSDPASGAIELARLFEGSLFGEMALLTRRPRAASVEAVLDADVLELPRGSWELLAAAEPSLRAALDRFARERWVKNVLVRSPLFRPFTPLQQADLLRRFEGLDVEPGTEVIRQGEPGLGLFVVLAGALEVVSAREGQTMTLAELGPGDIFGEMALVSSQPTSATVRAIAPSSLLFLSRTYVERLAAAIPEVQAYFEDIATQRARDNSLRLSFSGGDFGLHEAEVEQLAAIVERAGVSRPDGETGA
jgi:cAMP-dependent protein kinase regulator